MVALEKYLTYCG